MTTLRRGTLVEIVAFPKNRSFGHLAEYDGCEARILNLRGYGERLEAKVEVISATRGGPLKDPVPARALRRLEEECST